MKGKFEVGVKLLSRYCSMPRNRSLDVIKRDAKRKINTTKNMKAKRKKVGISLIARMLII